MRNISSFLREVEAYARMEFPKIGAPLQASYVTKKKSVKVFTVEDLFQPHIIDSGSTGGFVDVGYRTEEEAIIASNEVVTMLKVQKRMK